MLKISIALLALIGLIAATDTDVRENSLQQIEKQKFLFEIVYRVEDPLLFEEYIKLGKSFVYNKNDYTVSVRLLLFL